MKITQWIEIPGQEVEIELSSEDIQVILDADIESVPNIKRQLNSIALFLRAISPDTISKFEPNVRDFIGDFLAEQASRFRLS